MRYNKAEKVPSAPFADWLNQRYAYWQQKAPARSNPPGRPANEDRGAMQHLLAEIGWPDSQAGGRRLYRYRRQITETARGRNKALGIPRKHITVPVTEYPRAVVEDALHHAGVLFADLYPEIAAAEDIVLEPDSWCRGCQDMVHPINGQCPWCDWQINRPTGQALMGRVLKAAA